LNRAFKYKSMPENNEYVSVGRRLYDRTLMYESRCEFNPVLDFYYIDAVAHLDFSICLMAFNYQSVRNLMNMEYLRWRIDEEKKGDRVHFPAFINWLKKVNPEKFESLPTLWKVIYDEENPAAYRSFRISLDPDSLQPIPASFYMKSIDEFFDPKFLKSLYADGSLGKLFDEFMASQKE